MLEGISGYRKLERLNLDSNNIGDDGAAVMGKLMALPNMKLSTVEVNDNSLLR